MNKRSPVRVLLVRVLLLASLLAPNVIMAAEASPNVAPSTSLVQERHEDLDAYLQRVAATDPTLFQQATLAAVQDAFNGKLPEVEGEKSVEAQIAYYLHLAATGGQIQNAPTQSGSSSAVQGDAYLWNGTQVDEKSATGSTWQLTARPGGDTAAFANDFEKMLTVDPLPAGPSEAVSEPSQSQISAFPEQSAMSDMSRPASPVVDTTADAESSAVTPGSAAATPAESESADGGDAVLNGLLPRLIEERISQIPASVDAAQVVTQSHQADLGVSISVPTTTTFDEVITYTLTVTNHGPSPATNVRLTQMMPANGLYKPPVTGCAASDPETVNCSLGALQATQSISLSIPVTMKGNGVVTSTVTVKDVGGTVDPGKKPEKAAAATTVSSSKRSQREIGNFVIAANEFITVTGQIQASGAVEIGYMRPDKSFGFDLKLGPNDTLSWQNGADAITGEGTLAQVVENFQLFNGEFRVDGSKKEPLIVPGKELTPKVKKLAGFELVGTAVITQVSVISGTAMVSATIKMGQAGVLTPTNELLVGLIKPGGKAEGTIRKFTTEFAGLKIEASDAVFSDGKITIKKALVTMPERFGKLTGIISGMELTATSISFGSVGVQIPLPDIFPVGRPITVTDTISGTRTITPTIAFVKNSGTIVLDKGFFSLQVNSTLQLWLPGNHEKIPVEIKLDAKGKLEGTIKEIKLTIAGAKLSMKDVTIDDTGLKVEEASLTFKRESEKPKEEPPKEKKPESSIAVIVKKVTIDKTGLGIGSAGVSLPDIKVGDVATFSKLEFKLTIKTDNGVTNYEFDLKGKLKINLKDSEQEVDFAGKWDKDGNLSGKVTSLKLTIAKATLSMSDLNFNKDRFTAASATLTLPFLGNPEATITQVAIGENGISFGDASVKIPVEFAIGKKVGEPDPTNSFHVKGMLTLVLGTDRSYGFAIDGTVTIKVAAQTVAVGGSFRMDNNGTRGSVDSFELTIAGLTLAVKSAAIEEGVLKAQEATLSIPKEWGGLSATVYAIEISKEGFSIGGGSFKLPEIKVGDMRMTLEGTLKKEPGGWLIAAGGSLKLPNTGVGCSGVGVNVEIFAGTTQGIVMSIAPDQATPGTKFQLRKASVSLKCNIVLGASGFELTSITGTVTLNENVTRLDVKATIESQLRIGPFRAVTTDGEMYMEYVKNPYKFEIGIGASMRIFSMFEAARAKASMTFADSKVPFIFKAEMNINAVIARGEIKLTAWTSDGNFHLVGRIFGSVGVRRGAISNSCVRLPFIGNVCAAIPPSDLFIDATMEFGEFKHGNGSTWGLKASVSILGAEYGIYVNTEGNFKVGNVSEYRTIDTPSLHQARSLDARVRSGRMSPDALTAAEQDLLRSYHFAEDGITIDLADVLRPGDLNVDWYLTNVDADIQITLVRPDGLRIAASNAPDNVTISHDLVAPQDPTTGAPIQGSPPMLHTNITVTNAMLGTWRVFMDREPSNPFGITAHGTIYGPPVEKLAVAGQNDTDNHVDLSWHQSTPLTTTAVIYATQEPITTTASYTDTRTVTRHDGTVATEDVTVAGVVTQFGGQPVVEYSLDQGSQTLARSVDLSTLKTGSYHLWLEVNDGKNPPTRTYFPGTVAVWHPWEGAWTSNVRLTSEYGALTIAWDDHPNPDVDGYDVEITSADGSYVVDAGDVLSETITGLSPQTVYTVMVHAYNARTELISISEPASGSPLHAPFTVTVNRSALTIWGGGSGAATLRVASTVDPYPDSVFLHVLDLPDGMQAALSTTVVTPTVGGAQVGLVITPTTSLADGVYPITVQALSNGDIKTITILVTVKEPTFTARVSRNSLTLPFQGSVAVDISAIFRFGEQDMIDVDVIGLPPGVEWAFSPHSFLPGGKATLVLTDTGYLDFGTYEVIIEATDYQHTQEIVVPLTVAGFALGTGWDSEAVLNGQRAIFPVEVAGGSWRTPVSLGFDPQSVGDRFITTIARASVRVPTTVNVVVTPLPETPPGIYELELLATSEGITRDIPLYVTVQDDPLATDVLMDYVLPDEIFVVAGEVFTYTLSPRNISANPAEDVVVVDTMADDGLLTVVPGHGCGVKDTGTETALTCKLGTIDPYTINQDTTVGWLVAPDAPDGTVLAQTGKVIVRDTSPHTETSTLDNVFGVEHVVVRDSDLELQAESTPPTAGEVMTITATVINHGPSYADDTVVEFYLPHGVSLEASSPGCVQSDELLECPLGVLAPDEDAEIFAAMLVEPDYRGSLETLVIASSASYELNVDDNFAVVLDDVSATSQLRVTMTLDRTQALEGDTVDYLITVTNQGPSTATDVFLEVTTPQTAFIEDFQVGDVHTSLDHLEIAAGEVMTATAMVTFLEDDQGQPERVQVVAEAQEATPATVFSTAIRIANVNPTATLSDTVILDEGEVRIITVHSNDPGSDYDSFDIAWELDGDGDFDDSDQPSIRFDAHGMDGPIIQPIAVRITDDEGGQVTASSTVIVRNVAPVVATGQPQYKRYNLPFELPFQAYDPIVQDLQSAVVDWGDGNVEQVSLQTGGRDERATHTYHRIGTFTASVCVTDNDQGQGCGQVILQAACRDNGLLVRMTQLGSVVMVTIENASGTAAIPAGMPMTLYNGARAIHTFKLDTTLAVGASRTLRHSLADGNAALRLVVDDDGTGAKTTDLCTGTVSDAFNPHFKFFMTLVRR